MTFSFDAAVWSAFGYLMGSLVTWVIMRREESEASVTPASRLCCPCCGSVQPELKPISDEDDYNYECTVCGKGFDVPDVVTEAK